MSDELVDIGPNEDELRLKEEIAKAKALETSAQEEEDDKIRLAQALAMIKRGDQQFSTDGRPLPLTAFAGDGPEPFLPRDTSTGPSIGAMPADEVKRFEEETRLEELKRDFINAPGSTLNLIQDTPAGRFIADRAFRYAYYWGNPADKPFWAGDDVNADGMPVERYDNPFMGAIHSVRRGATKGLISVANSLYSFMGADLDYLPNPQTALTPVDYGAEGEGSADTVFALTEGFSQFMAPFVMSGGTGGGFTRAYGVGAVVDFSAFDPRNGNATTFLRELGVGKETLANLDAKEVYEKDGEYSARLRSLAEGGGLGLAADVTLRTALRTLRGLRRVGGEAIEDARNFSRLRKVLDVSGDKIGAGGPTGLPLEILDTPLSQEGTKAFNSLIANYIARNARAAELLRRNPEMPVAEIFAKVEAEYPSSEITDAAREAWAQAAYTASLGRPGEAPIESWRASAQMLDPNRTFVQGTVTEELGREANQVLFQDPRTMAETVARSERSQGPGRLSAEMTAQIKSFAEENGLSKANVQALRERVSQTLQDFPLAEWSKLEPSSGATPFIAWKEGGVGKFDPRNRDLPQVDITFAPRPYSFADTNPKSRTGKNVRFGSPEADARVDQIATRGVAEIDALMQRVEAGDVQAQNIFHARGWYAAMRKRLGREWGNSAPLFAELLGALSPRTKVAENFASTIDVMQQYSRGTFDDLLNDYVTHLDNGGSFKDWVEGGNPIIGTRGRMAPNADFSAQAGLSRYGINSQKVMDTLAGHWISNRFDRFIFDPDQVDDYVRRGILKLPFDENGRVDPEALADIGLEGFEDLPARFERMGFRAIVDDLKSALTKAKAGDSLTETQNALLQIVESASYRGAQLPIEGAAPKAINFALNLGASRKGSRAGVGAVSRAATIDVWAGRFLDRMSGAKPVPPAAEQGVAGNFATANQAADFRLDATSDAGAATSQFGIGQRAMDEIASRLREKYPEQFGDMRPDDLQAMVWFLEKERWSKRGWTNSAGADGSFDLEADKFFSNAETARGLGDQTLANAQSDLTGRVTLGASTVTDNPPRQIGDLQVRQALPVDDTEAISIIETALSADDTVLGFNVGKNTGLFLKEGEDSISAEITYGRFRGLAGQQQFDRATGRTVYPLQEEPTLQSILGAAADLQKRFQQDSVIVSRVLDNTTTGAGAVPRDMTVDELLTQFPNARPGLEIFFDAPKTREELSGLIGRMGGRVQGLQTILDVQPGATRAAESADRIIGIRTQFIPEYEWGAAEQALDANAYKLRMAEKFEEFYVDILRDVKLVDGVARIDPIAVDTAVIGDSLQYTQRADEVLGNAGRNAEEVASEVWDGRPWNERTSGRTEPPESPDAGGPREEPDPPTDGGDQTLYQSDPSQPGGEIATPGGRAIVDQDAGIALLGFYRAADGTTAVHEAGHAIRVTAFGRRSKAGIGPVQEESVLRVEEQYGVKGGNWTRAQEEKFAQDFVAWIADGGPRGQLHRDLPEGVQDAFEFAAAHTREVLKDSRDAGVKMNATAGKMLDDLLANNVLPQKYAPGRYVRMGNFDKLIKQIEEAEAAGEDWTQIVKPEDILGTTRDKRLAERFSAETPEDALRMIAYMNAFTRELMERDVLVRPRNVDAMRQMAIERLNMALGRDNVDIDQTMSELLSGVDMRVTTGQGALDSRVMASNMLLAMKAQALVSAAKRAKAGDKVAIAEMHRAALEYQVVQSSVAAAGTNWGRAGVAMQNVKLPSPDELQSVQTADAFLVSLGMDEGALVGDSNALAEALTQVELPDDLGFVGKVVREMGKNGGKPNNRAMSMIREYYVNNLLSGPKTFFTLSVFSPMLNQTVDSLSKTMGAMGMMATGNITGGTQVIREQLNAIGYARQSLAASFEYMVRTLKTGEATLMPGTHLDDATSGPAIRSDSSNPLIRGAVNGVGAIVRTPSRAIMTFDEFFRQMSARVALSQKFMPEVQERVIKAAIDRGDLPPEPTSLQRQSYIAQNRSNISRLVENEVDNVIRDGRLRDGYAIIDEAVNRPEIAAIDNEVERIKAIQDYYNTEHTDTHSRNVGYGKDYATRAVFQGELGPVGKQIQAFLDNFMGGTLRFIVPFFRTPWKIQEKFFSMAPTNVLAELANRSTRLVGGKGFTLSRDNALFNVHRDTMADLASGDPRRIAEARGRQIFGTGFALFAYDIAQDEEVGLTGGGPMDFTERAQLRETGWQPYSFRIKTGDDEKGEPVYKYLSYTGWDPLAQYLAMAADTFEYLEDQADNLSENEGMAFVSAMIHTFGAQMHEKPYIQGISNLAKVMQDSDPRKLENFLRSQTQGFIPFASAQAQISMARDPIVRDYRTYLDFLRGKTAMFGNLNEGIPPKYNALGEPVRAMTETSMDASLLGMPANFNNRINVSKLSLMTDDPIYKELDRAGVVLRPPKPVYLGVLDLREIPATVGEFSAYDQWMRNMGQAYKTPRGDITLRGALQLFIDEMDKEAPGFMRFDPDPVTGRMPADSIKSIVSAFRNLAWQKTLEENPKLKAAWIDLKQQQVDAMAENIRTKTPEGSPLREQSGRATEQVNRRLEALIGGLDQ